jgi:hypothetical protein
MKAFFCTLLTIYSTLSLAQDNRGLEKWLKAVINIETRVGYQNTYKYQELVEKLQKKTIGIEEFNKQSYSLLEQKRNESCTGTAIFLKHKSRYYLITARHVLEDTTTDFRRRVSSNDISERVYTDRVVDMILFIENASTLRNYNYSRENAYISDLNEGRKPFIFTSKEDDLAILNLDNTNVLSNRITALKEMGYVPIEMADIDSICDLKQKQVITSIGFTDHLSERTIKHLDGEQLNMQSDILSLPIVSDGFIANLLGRENYFMGNIFVFNGNSGGAIISNNKLVGIVSGAKIEMKQVPSFELNEYIYTNIKIVKASLIRDLVERLSKRIPSL